MWLLPSPSLWTAEEALVVTPSRNYSAHDYDDLFEAVGFTDGPGLLARVQDLTSDFTDPAVSVYPRYGTGVATPQQVFYPTFWAYQFDAESDLGEFPDCSFGGDRSWWGQLWVRALLNDNPGPVATEGMARCGVQLTAGN